MPTATTYIRPYKVAAGKGAVQTMEERFDYGLNPKKLGALSSYLCDPATAPAEFLLVKSQYQAETGRTMERGALFFQIRQAFPPGEVTAQEANQIGYETAMRWTKGKYQFLSAPTQTRGTSTITFISIQRPLTVPGSSIILSAPVLPCGGSLTGCALSMISL